MQTPAQIADTLKQVKAIGFAAVELAGLGPLSPEQFAAILKQEDLACCSAHESGDELFHATDKVIERARVLGNKLVAYPWPAGVDFGNEAELNHLIANLNEAGRKLHEAGLTLLYHNHQLEFRKIGGKICLEKIYDETEPQFLQGELDTYWVQFGGENLLEWCQKLHGRLPVLHMKDYLINAENQPMFAEIGQGNLNWPAVLAAADTAGCQWFVVEQDVCPGNPLDSLKRSFDFVKTQLVNK